MTEAPTRKKALLSDRDAQRIRDILRWYERNAALLAVVFIVMPRPLGEKIAPIITEPPGVVLYEWEV